jgi:hypothetical protein
VRKSAEERIESIMKFRSKTITVIVMAAILVIGTMTAFAANSLTTEANNNDTIVGSNAKVINKNGDEKPVSDEQVNFAGGISLDNDWAINFSLNNASTLDGINLIVNPIYWGSTIFDENGKVRNDGEVKWDFYENEEAYRDFESKIAELNNDIPLPPQTHTDEEWAQIVTEIEGGVLKPFNLADYLAGKEGVASIEVSFYDGQNVFRIGK